MNRVLLIGAFLIATAGCRAPMPKFDPFLPQTPQRIPPPSTGSVRPAPDPYLQTPTGNLSPVPPVSGTNASPYGGLPPTNAATAPTLRNSAPARTRFGATLPSEKNDSGTSTAPQFAGMPVNDATLPSEPPPFHATLTARDLSPISSENHASPLFRRTSAGGSNDRLQPVVVAGGSSTVELRQTQANAIPSDRDKPDVNLDDVWNGSETVKRHYSHNASYTQLSGRLHYEASKRRWRLRYIASDAADDQIDPFGGSVILHDPHIPSKYRDGDFISVKGKLGNTSSKQGDFAPPYDISSIVSAQ